MGTRIGACWVPAGCLLGGGVLPLAYPLESEYRVLASLIGG